MSTQHVYIIGSKGIPAKYGGFETFVENLTSKKINESIKYHVACMGKDNYTFEHNNAMCFNINVPNIGPAKAVYYDVMALKQCIKDIKENNVENGIVYILACRIGPFIGHYKKKLKKLGIKLYVNPDGHEWKRAKWNWLIKKYWKFSEKLMVKHADLLICDSVNIEKYIKEDYKKYNPNTTFIAYGSDVTKSTLKDDDEQLLNWYKEKNVKPKEYYLVVGRFVPENNYETMITEYMKSKTTKDFVLITNVEQNKFYDALKEKTHFEQDKRIKFVGTVYDQELLKKIRENAYGYIHGHEVGGTNPSLLEALASTKLNLLLDVGFNKEVGQDGAVYWNKEEGNLSNLINKLDNILEDEIEKYSNKAKKRIQDEYSWKKIVEDYEKIFLKKKILLISNMYPSKEYPHYGVFVKNTENILLENEFEVEKSVLSKKDGISQKILGYISFYKQAIKMARECTYDAIYGHYISHSSIPILLIKRKNPKIKIIVNVHGNDIVPEDKKDEKFIIFSKKLLNKSDVIIAPSEYFKNILKNNYNIEEERIVIYPSGGIDTKKFRPIEKKQAKEILDLDLKTNYIGFVSRLEIRKGWDTLLGAIKILDDKIEKNIKFLFVGDGKEREDFLNKIKQLHIEERILHMPFKSQNELSQIYNSLEIFCFPTYRKSESLGLVGLEAMSCGSVVLASNMGGPKDYIKDGINGYLFEPQNSIQLADKIISILELNESEKNKIREEAIKTSKMFDENIVKDQLLNVFNKL